MWHNQLMARVTLPLGYPLQSGAFETFVYQGNVVREYINTPDPRTDNQLWRRKLFSDIAQMRASLGAYPKAAYKIQFGTRWSTIIIQICLADIGGHWSTAWDQWDAMTQQQRDYISFHVPFYATWNDPGRVWWAMYSALYNWALDHDQDKFHMPPATPSENDDALGWWSQPLTAYDLQPNTDIPAWQDNYGSLSRRTGSWQYWNGPGPRDNTMSICETVGGYAEITKPFTHVRLWYGKNTDRGNLDVYYDGAVQETINQNGAESYQYKYDLGYIPPAQQPVRFIHGGPAGKLIDIDGIELWTNYKGDHVELTGDDWTTIANPGAVDGYYHERQGGGIAQYFFNFVGRYAQIFYPTKPTYTTWAFRVDGIFVAGVYAYAPTETHGQSTLLGPFRDTLHRCEVTAHGGQLAIDTIKIRNYKRDL